MEFTMKILNLQLELFVLILTGLTAAKIGLISQEGRKTLSSLLINIILPANIIHAFLADVDLTNELFHNAMLAVVLGSILMILSHQISRLLFCKMPDEHRRISVYGMICSNSSFVAIPVAEALYGDIGVLYASIFQIPIRIAMWTAGLAQFTDVKGQHVLKKVLLHPCIVSIGIGVLLMIGRIHLPVFIDTSIAALSRCTTPVSMLTVGAILSDADWKTMFSKDVLYYSLIRLIVFPLLIDALLIPLQADAILKSITVILAAMPAGSTTSILAQQYHCDPVFASQCIFVSTLFSIATIPLISLFL